MAIHSLAKRRRRRARPARALAHALCTCDTDEMEENVALTIPMHWGDWTADDFFALGETEARMELVDGNLVLSPSPSVDHQRVERQLLRAFADLGPGFEAFAEIDVELGRALVRRPDVLVASPPARSRVAPDEVILAVEVVSPSSIRDDRVRKPEEYAAAGIRGYWRIELEPVLLFAAYALRGDHYVEVGEWGAGEVAEISEPFAITIPVDDLVRRAG